MALDSFGRSHDAFPVSDFTQEMLRPVNKTPYKEGKSQEKPDYIKFAKNLEDLNHVFEERCKSDEKFVKMVMKNLEDVKKGKSEKGGVTGSRGGLSDKGLKDALDSRFKSLEKGHDLMSRLAKKGLEKGSIYTHDVTNEMLNRKILRQGNTMVQLLTSINKNIKAFATNDPASVAEDVVVEAERDEEESVSRRASSPRSQHGSRSDYNDSRYVNNSYRDRRLFGKESIMSQWEHFKEQLERNQMMTAHFKIKDAASGIMSQGEGTNPMQRGLFGTGGMQGLSTILEGLGKANEYQRNISEIARVTEGVTGDMLEQKKVFLANKELTNSAISTGIDSLKIQDQYVKLLRSGFKTQKDTLRLTKTGANLSVALGSNFEQTADFANDLHMALGMSVDSVEEISRGMKQTARSSKISGDAMINAARSAQPFLEALRDAGTLTASAASSMIGMQASLNKFGVGSKFNDILTAMTSPSAAMNASFQTQSMMALMHPRGIGAFMDGTMQDPKEQLKGMKMLSQNVKMMFGTSIEEMSKMTQDQLADFIHKNPGVDIKMKEQLGHGAGEFVGLFKAAEDGWKTFEDRMKDVNKKLMDVATTEEERTKLLKQQDDLLQGQRDLITSKSSGILSGSANLPEAFAKMRGNKDLMSALNEGAKGGLFGKDFDAKSLNTDAGLKAALQKEMTDSFTRSNDVLTKSTSPLDDRFKIDPAKVAEVFASGDVKGIEKLQKQMLEASDAAENAIMGSTDPAREASNGINALNAQFAEYASDALMYLKQIAGSKLIMGLGVASLITGVLAPLGLNKDSFKGLKDFAMRVGGEGKLKGFLSRGVTDAVGGINSAGRYVKGKAGELIGAVGNSRFSQFGKNAVDGIKNSRFSQFGKNAVDGIKSAGSYVKGAIANSDTVRFGSGLLSKGKAVAADGLEMGGGLLNTGVKGTRGLAKGIGKMWLPITLFIAAMEGVNHAMETGAKAAQIFEVPVEQLGKSQVAAAENAGMLTGTLNALSFGILGWIPGFDSAEAALARFIHSFPLLNNVLSAIMVPFKAVYELLVGIWTIVKNFAGNVWTGLTTGFSAMWDGIVEGWEAAKIALEPLREAWGEFTKSFGPVGDVLSNFVADYKHYFAELFGGLKNSEVVIKILVIGLKLLGKSLGFLITVGAALVSNVLTPILNAITSLVQYVGGIFKPALQSVIDLLQGNFAGFFTNAFYAVAASFPSILLTGFKTLGSGIGSIFSGVLNWIATKAKEVVSTVSTGVKAGASTAGSVAAAAIAPGPMLAWSLFDWAKGKFPGAAAGLVKDVPGFDTGGVINTSGLAMIHAGEIVVPKSDVDKMSIASGDPLTGSGGFGALNIGDSFERASSILGTANSMPMGDIESRVEQDRVSGQPSSAVATSEMSTIATLTERQLVLMTDQLYVLEEIRDQLSSGPNLSGYSTIGSSSTRSNSKPGNSPNYYDLSFGGYGGNASKGYVNDGVT